MRVISGIFKGKKIITPPDKTTRPLKDITKESIFNIINHSNKFSMKIQDAVILDLFSGVGSFGIECISRGAKKVIFFENYLQALNILEKNLKSLKKVDNFEIYKEDFFNSNKKLLEKFDLIFVDPPYKEKRINEIIKNILENKLLKPNGVVVIHRHKKDDIPITEKLNIIEERSYGISKILFGS